MKMRQAVESRAAAVGMGERLKLEAMGAAAVPAGQLLESAAEVVKVETVQTTASLAKRRAAAMETAAIREAEGPMVQLGVRATMGRMESTEAQLAWAAPEVREVTVVVAAVRQGRAA